MPDNAAPPHDPLAQECLVFTRYLAGREPDQYIRAGYARGHAGIPYRQTGGLTGADRMLIGVARLGTIPARTADIYGRFFRPTGALRQKLTLLYAVLENSPETHTWFNSANTGNPVALLASVALSGTASMLLLFAGIVLLGPLHLAVRLTGSPARREA